MTRARIAAMLVIEGITLAGLAKRVGWHVSAASMFLSGARKLRRSEGGHRYADRPHPIEEIARALDVPVESLEHGDPCPLCGKPATFQENT